MPTWLDYLDLVARDPALMSTYTSLIPNSVLYTKHDSVFVDKGSVGAAGWMQATLCLGWGIIISRII